MHIYVGILLFKKKLRKVWIIPSPTVTQNIWKLISILCYKLSQTFGNFYSYFNSDFEKFLER